MKISSTQIKTVSFSALFFFVLALGATRAHATDYRPIGEKNWLSEGAFSVRVENIRTHEQKGPITFHAISIEEFKLQTGNHGLPDLYPKTTQSCSTFRERVASQVSQWKLVDYKLRFEGHLGQNRYLQPLLQPRDPLSCKLKDIALDFDREKCAFVAKKLIVAVAIPGADKDMLLVDILQHLPEWASAPVTFTDLTPADVVSVNKKKLVEAAGRRCTCTIPALTGIEGFEQPSKKTFAHYLPTPDTYKGAVFAALFPVNHPKASSDEVWTVVYRDDDYYDSEGSSFSSCYSMIEGASVNESIAEPYEFYELYGEPEAIPANINPFIYFASNGQAYYTKAFQRRAYRVTEGAIDETLPYVLQYFVATNISCDRHNLGKQGGFGLRWTIRDKNGLPVLPLSCQSKPLDTESMQINLKTLIIEHGNNAPLACYSVDVQTPSDILKAVEALPTVFVKTDSHVCIRLNKASEPYVYDAMNKFFSTYMVNGSIRELELDASVVDYTPGYYKQIGEINSLKKLVIKSSDRFFYPYLYSNEQNDFPPNLETLEIYETTLVNCPSYRPMYTHSLCNMQNRITKLSRLKKLVFHTIGSQDIRDAIGSLTSIINGTPSLEELDIVFPSFYDAYWANESAGEKTCAGCPGTYINVQLPHAESDFERVTGYDRDAFREALKKSRIKKFRFVIPTNPPKGCDMVYLHGNKYNAKPIPVMREWTHLLRLLDELPQFGIQVIR